MLMRTVRGAPSAGHVVVGIPRDAYWRRGQTSEHGGTSFSNMRPHALAVVSCCLRPQRSVMPLSRNSLCGLRACLPLAHAGEIERVDRAAAAHIGPAVIGRKRDARDLECIGL